MDMKILITGGNGQLGSEIASILRSGKSQIGDIDSRYAGCDITSVDVDRLDITDTAAVTAFVGDLKPDLIFNCAAMTNVNGCESNLELAMKVNAIGSRNLAEAAQMAEAKLIHVSTDYVFAGDGTVPYCEWDIPAPKTVYGKSKLLGEQYVTAHCHRCFIVRTAWLYGAVGNNFVKTMLKLGAEKDSLKVVNDQRGNPTNANDLAHHLLLLGLSEEYGIYHCTGEGECSWYDFAKRIMELGGLSCRVEPCTTEEFPSPASRPAYSSLNNLMLKCTVGNHMRSWEDAIEDYMNTAFK